MICEVHNLNSLKSYKYVVIFAKYKGQWVFCRHKQRTTWETAGGHIEKGESPLEAARRELYEESGAKDFTIRPICDYGAADDVSHANGMVFFADIEHFGEMPQFEMERASCLMICLTVLPTPELRRCFLPISKKCMQRENAAVTDAHIHLERGAYTLKWLNQFIGTAVERNM